MHMVAANTCAYTSGTIYDNDGTVLPYQVNSPAMAKAMEAVREMIKYSQPSKDCDFTFFNDPAFNRRACLMTISSMNVIKVRQPSGRCAAGHACHTSTSSLYVAECQPPKAHPAQHRTRQHCNNVRLQV